MTYWDEPELGVFDCCGSIEAAEDSGQELPHSDGSVPTYQFLREGYHLEPGSHSTLIRISDVIREYIAGEIGPEGLKELHALTVAVAVAVAEERRTDPLAVRVVIGLLEGIRPYVC